MADVTVKVSADTSEIDDAIHKAGDLVEAVEKAKSLAGDLAKMMDGMSVKINV